MNKLLFVALLLSSSFSNAFITYGEYFGESKSGKVCLTVFQRSTDSEFVDFVFLFDNVNAEALKNSGQDAEAARAALGTPHAIAFLNTDVERTGPDGKSMTIKSGVQVVSKNEIHLSALESTNTVKAIFTKRELDDTHADITVRTLLNNEEKSCTLHLVKKSSTDASAASPAKK